MLAKSHPYNPLWAQLSDLYGAIGMPPRLARTVVTGNKIDTIEKFLFVLSYFIRYVSYFIRYVHVSVLAVTLY